MIRINTSTDSAKSSTKAEPVEKLSKDFIRLLRGDLAAALHEVGAKHGVVLTAGICRFSDLSAKMNLQISTIAKTGEVIDPERSELLLRIPYLHLGADALEKTFTLGGKKFKIAGYKKARWKKPFSLTCQETGMRYVATESQVRASLGLPAPTAFTRHMSNVPQFR
jgi:hypothetical protein